VKNKRHSRTANVVPQCGRVEESLHFARAAVKLESTAGVVSCVVSVESSAPSSRQVPVEKQPGSPYGTHIRWWGVILQRRDALSASCPPMFLWKREGFRKHAVALSQLMGEVVGG